MNALPEVLRPVLPSLADEIIATIGAEIADYERPMDGPFGRGVRLGVETALRRFVDDLEGTPGGQSVETYVILGRGEFHAGRSLENLLAAYRVGARVTWRRFVEAGTAGGIAPEALFAVGEQIFAYIDTLSSESADGYAREQRAEAGERRRSRARLIEALEADEDVRDPAAAAGWELPREVAALAVAVGPPEDATDVAEALARAVGPGAVATGRDGVALVILGDPDAPGRRRRVASAVGERRAVLGPTVGLGRASHTVRRALQTLRLAAAPGVADAAAHLPALMLGADAALAAELAADRLAPLDALPPPTAARLAVTLRAWVDRPGQVQPIAHALGVHPQTVRYRVRQLRELFGGRLDDPEARFELGLALRARALAG